LGVINRFLGLFSHDIGIDLGTATTLVWVRGKGIVIREPSIVAQHRKSKRILAIGTRARQMMGKTPASIKTVRPLRDGVISDFETTTAMLTYFIHQVHHRPHRLVPAIPRPRVVVGIPSGITEVERRAVRNAAVEAGAREVFLIEEPMAAAIGAGLAVEEPSGSMIVDIGGGTTEIAVISLGGIVVNVSLRVAGDEMDEALVDYFRKKQTLLIGERTAEEVKIQIGQALGEEARRKEKVVRGRDLRSGLPRSMKVSSDQVEKALSGVIGQIVRAVSDTLRDTPPELIADILEQGIVLAGGGALLWGIDKVIAQATGMPVWVADDPLTCVVRGCGAVLENIDLLHKVRVVGGLD
jgi:rod shape-determining protein MreB